MKIAINGTSGFVGKHLIPFFEQKGYEVVKIKRVAYDNIKELKNLLSGCDGVINLAGASISKKWTKEYKKVLFDSRIKTTKCLVQAINEMQTPPSWLLSTSAVGIYKEAQAHDENSTNFNDGFLGNLAKEWESEALKAQEAGVKVSILRFGVVLGNGGAMSEMLPIFKLGLGGVLGDGKQGFSWIHVKDLLKACEFVISQNGGIFNFTAPNPTTNEIFTKTLGKTLKKPTFFKVPPFALKLKFGEGASILLSGQEVYPKKLLESGFAFEFSTIQEALEDLL